MQIIIVYLIMILIVMIQGIDLINDESVMFRKLNQYRMSQNLELFKMNRIASKYAYQHCKNMADGKIPVGHDGFEERMKKIKQEGVAAVSWRENVAMSKPDMNPIDAWKKSNGHNKAMLTSYFNQVGIGYCMNEEDYSFYVLILMKVDSSKKITA